MRPISLVNTRLHSIAARLAREAAAAGFTSVTVTATPLDYELNSAPANIRLVMPPQELALALAGRRVDIRTDSCPALLQCVGPKEEYAFRHVCEAVFAQGFNAITVVHAQTPPEEVEVKLAGLILNSRKNRFYQFEPLSADNDLIIEPLAELMRPGE